jgi:hypothetical protein
MDFDFKRLTERRALRRHRAWQGGLPYGRVSLAVAFDTEENFRIEYLNFEVANFMSSYHAILGHPMLAWFMAVPHYTY